MKHEILDSHIKLLQSYFLFWILKVSDFTEQNFPTFVSLRLQGPQEAV